MCVQYGQNNERVACAAKVESDLTVNVTNIAGLAHKLGDDAFNEPNCSGLELDTTAADVEGDQTKLEAYVTDVIGAVQEDVKNIALEEVGEVTGINLTDPNLSLTQAELIAVLAPLATMVAELDSKLKTRIQERLFCFGSGDFKHESIYPFIMGADLANSTVIVNGNSFDLNGGNLDLTDNQLRGEQNIAKLFNNALGGGLPSVGASATVKYHWLKPGDTPVDMWFERKVVPGNSPKTSYIEVADLNKRLLEELVAITNLPDTIFSPFFPPELYIFGSGVYPEDDGMMDDMDDMDDIVDEVVDAVSGGGCTIAGTSNTSQGALLNLFLIASVLFSVVFLRRRV